MSAKIRFIHCADLHLNSSLSLDFSRAHSQPSAALFERITTANFDAWQRIVDFACQEQVDFVLIAGDIFNHADQDYHSAIRFADSLMPLKKAKIPLYMIKGNHDAVNKSVPSLELPEGCHLFGSRPECIESARWAIHGCSYQAYEQADNLVPTYPKAVLGKLNIGLLNTGMNDAHYAPCSRQDLIAKNYDYWALGHIHLAESMDLGRGTWAAYSGIPQGRHINKSGEKGFWLIECEGQEIEKREFIVSSLFEWHKITAKASSLQEARKEVLAQGKALLEAQSAHKRLDGAEEPLLCLRVHYANLSQVMPESEQALLLHLFAHEFKQRVLLEKLSFALGQVGQKCADEQLEFLHATQVENPHLGQEAWQETCEELKKDGTLTDLQRAWPQLGAILDREKPDDQLLLASLMQQEQGR